MELILDEHRPQLHPNFADDTKDHLPVVKLFCPWGPATWIVTCLDPEDNDTAFGLCDLGLGCPELGYLSLSEIRSLKGPFGLRIERDLHFRPLCSLLCRRRHNSDYAEQIVMRSSVLEGLR